MLIVIDKIKLKDTACADEFVKWVKEVDYAACHNLPSVMGFHMQRVERGGDCDFLEIVQISSWSDFEKDMRTPLFQSLVARFSQMADVSEQIICDPIPPGYRQL
ncbi:MAG: RedY protein [Gammaproteobacteria bacterium]|nr:RedY protein [Gammaproteobacteria bacterium]